jgi:hypothetical protein
MADAGTAWQVEPSDRFIRGGDDNVGVLGPTDELDAASVYALTNLETSRGRDRCRDSRLGRSGQFSQVENTELLLHATGSDEVRIVGRVCDGANDVVVLKGVKQVASMGVPDLASRER